MEHTNKVISISVISIILALALYSNKRRIKRIFHSQLSKLKDAKDAEFIKEVGREILRSKKQYL